jgi:hypothetical protein
MLPGTGHDYVEPVHPRISRMPRIRATFTIGKSPDGGREAAGVCGGTAIAEMTRTQMPDGLISAIAVPPRARLRRARRATRSVMSRARPSPTDVRQRSPCNH